MDFEESLRYLEEFRSRGVKPRLEAVRQILGLLGFSFEGRVVLVAGTNGKGSCATVLARILEEDGLRVGLYTSPSLVDFRERIAVNGFLIPEKVFAKSTRRFRQVVEDNGLEPTFFEAVTAVALSYFSEAKVDVMVLEAGMGGRLDAVNVLDPDVSVITSVDMDHQSFLGGTLEEIALEKAGIIREGGFLACSVSGPLRVLLENHCRKLGARMSVAGDFMGHVTADADGVSFRFRLKQGELDVHSSLRGVHQCSNIACAILAARELGASSKAVLEGVSGSVVAGRLEFVSDSPRVLVDCAHNPAGVRALKDYLSLLSFKRLITVCGFSGDKDVREMVDLLSDSDVFIATKSRSERACNPEAITSYLPASVLRIEEGSVGEAVFAGLKTAREGDLILVTGSVFVAGEALAMWRRLD